jgi:hypothetical protein
MKPSVLPGVMEDDDPIVDSYAPSRKKKRNKSTLIVKFDADARKCVSVVRLET